MFSVSTSGGPVQNLTTDNAADDSDPVFSPDGKTIAYGAERKADGWPDYTRLAVKDLATGRTSLLTDGWENAARELGLPARREEPACSTRRCARA